LRTQQKHSLENSKEFKQNLLSWAQQFNDILWLDSNSEHFKTHQNYATYDAILAVDAFTAIQTDYFDAFDKLKEYYTTTKDWIFGYLTYDLKNDTEALTSNNDDRLEFPDLYFFQPKKLFLIKGNTVETLYLKAVDNELDEDLLQIRNIESKALGKSKNDIPPKIKLKTHKEEYFAKVRTMQSHIYRGDIYEANFCQEFYAEDTTIMPLDTYNKLNTISNAPFASFLKLGRHFLLSASPERYLKKIGSKIISQPIKGTAKRDQDQIMDSIFKNDLVSDEKERSENIMIVDLVRNDLSHTAIKGSVQVQELCKIYSFDQVHHMISTVISEVKSTTHPIDILKTTFPMGSMTGVPKISAMRIIETLENTKRGLYSGSVGYIAPTGDFDFNVVIRSILYNEAKQYVSYSVGGAITAKSNPLKEYEECLVKAKAMREVLEGHY